MENNNWQVHFDRESKSPVFLEEVAHVYINKKTGKRYTSVTTALSLVKNEFDQKIKKNMVKGNKTTFRWFKKLGYCPKTNINELVEIIKLYKTYSQHVKQKLGLKWTKTLSSYKNLDDFFDDYLPMREQLMLDEDDVKIYFTSSGEPMDIPQIEDFWKAITHIANIYGTMVHEIVEQYILLHQKFIKESNIEERIREAYDEINNIIKNAENTNWSLSKHIFNQYKINLSLEDFKNKIIDSFNSLNCDLGRVCIPEKLMYNERYRICGTCDVFVDVDDVFFDIGDHKTNKVFTRVSLYGKKLKKPVSHLDDCDLHNYNIQMSIYALMHELQTGKKLRRLWISYFSRKTMSFEKIDLPYLKNEALAILKMHEANTKKIVSKFKKREMLNDVEEIYYDHLCFILDKKHKYFESNGDYYYLDANNDEQLKSPKIIREMFDKEKNNYLIQQRKIKW